MNRSLLRKPLTLALAGAVLIGIILSLEPSSRFAGQTARAQGGGIVVTTDQFVYNPGDKVSFSIKADSGGAAQSGDLRLRVYPAASFQDPKAFTNPPLADVSINSAFSVNGQASTAYQASLQRLKAGTGGFPVKVSLISDGREVLSGETWLAVVDPGAHTPLDLVLLWTVGSPPQRDPQGEFTGEALLNRCQATPRTPDTILQHLDLAQKYPRLKTTYAIEGSLIDELSDMSKGFITNTGGGSRQLDAGSGEAKTASGCLDSLRSLAASSNTEILSTPYTFANLPTLARNGWSDGNSQYRIGHDVLTADLGLPAVPSGAYIPQLDLTTDSLRFVADTGGEYAVMAGSLRQAAAGNVAPADATFRMRDLSGERLTSMFANDDASQALLGLDPHPNAFFAALANAYGSDNPRLTIVASALSNPGISADLRDKVYAEIDSQPWLQSLTLGEAKDKYRPSTQPVTLTEYKDPLAGYVTRAYFDSLSQVHEPFEDYRVAVDGDEPDLLREEKNMFTAESEYFLKPDATPGEANQGLGYVSQVAGAVQQAISGIGIDVDTPWLQRSAAGEATISMTNRNPYALNLELKLSGGGVRFPNGAGQKLRLPPGGSAIKVPYSSGGWSHLTARLQSRGHTLADDSAGIRPVTTRVWIVILVGVAAALGALAYFLLVVRRR